LGLTEKAIGLIPEGKDLELIEYLSRFTLDVLGRTIFNHDFKRLDGENDKYYRAYKTLLISNPWHRMLLKIPGGSYLPLQAFKDHFQGLETMMELFREVVKEHKGKVDHSILSNLIHSNETTEKLSDSELYANIWIFFFAGHETTVRALVMALNMLWRYPEVQEKLYEEIHGLIGTDRKPTEADLHKMVYLEAFITEVLRYRSPLTFLRSRMATKDLQYKNMIIPKGALCGVQIQSLHTNPLYWDEPDKFNPDRFLPQNRKPRHKFSFMPFSLGPRICIGNNFSLMEQRLFLVMLLQKYRVVDPKSHAPLAEDSYFILTKSFDSHVSFEKRI